ncbi:hypothetical protein WEI85_27915 [Actinomycetes bacterium KLBMP 9797]
MKTMPIALAVLFTTVITGWFNLSEALPLPLALLVGAAWGVAVGLVGTRLRSTRPWLEDAFIYLGTVGFAFAGCGGLMAILLLDGALDSSSLTGETLESTFLPSIPYYIVANGILETLIIPGVVVFSWRPGARRILVLIASALYFAMRVWTYLAFVPARLGWAESDHSAAPMTPAERRQAADALMLDDPRWVLLVAMFAIFLFAAYKRPAPMVTALST